MIRLTIDTGR